MGDDYSFLQEKIKDEAGSPKTLKKKIFRVILWGFIFGIVACFTFFAVKPVVRNLLGQDKEEVSIPEDEEEIEEMTKAEEDAAERKAEQEKIKLLQKLQSTAKSNAYAIVSVSGQKKIEKGTEIMKTAGVIIADNGAEILVLCETLSEKTLKNVKITFPDGSEYPANVKMKDNNIGLVVCAVEKSSVKEEVLKDIDVIKLGNSLIVKSGDPVVLIGRSRENNLQVSYGFITSNKDKVEIADGSLEVIYTDVAGAVFENGMILNQDGQMIGLVNTKNSEKDSVVAVYSISDIKKEIEYLSNEKAVPYTGIWGVTLPDTLKSDELENGICVKELDIESPAMEAGIQCGDIITQIGDTYLSNMEEYRNILLRQNEKDILVMKGLRKGADDEYVEMEFEVVVGRK